MNITRNTRYAHLTVRFMGRRGILRINKGQWKTKAHPYFYYRRSDALGLTVQSGPVDFFLRPKR